MTTLHYACAVRVGSETEVAEELAGIASWVWVARHMQPVIVGPRSNRQREWQERPMWPGYVFARMSADEFFASRTVKHLSPTKLALERQEVTSLLRAVDIIDAQMEADKRRIAKDSAPPVDFTAGDRVEVLDGVFAGRLASYARAVRKADGYFAGVQIDGAAFEVLVPAVDLRAVG